MPPLQLADVKDADSLKSYTKVLNVLIKNGLIPQMQMISLTQSIHSKNTVITSIIV